MIKKKYYKVVSRKKAPLESASVQGVIKVIYRINKWVSAKLIAKRKGYGLFVFDSVRAAKNFVYKCDWYLIIYRCDVRDVHKMLPSFLSNRHEYFCNDEPPIPSSLLSWPPGTVMVDRVKLIEEVTYDCNNK